MSDKETVEESTSEECVPEHLATVIVLDQGLVDRIKSKFGDKVDITDLGNKALRFMLDTTEQPEQLIVDVEGARTALRDLIKYIEPAKTLCDILVKNLVIVAPQTQTTDIGDAVSNMQRAKETIAQNDLLDKSNIMQKTGRVQVGMSSTKPTPASAVKPLTNEKVDTNIIKPGKPITNTLMDNPPSPEVAKQLAQMKKDAPKSVAHPSGIIGPDMGKEVTIR
jgi:hypothetical protein